MTTDTTYTPGDFSYISLKIPASLGEHDAVKNLFTIMTDTLLQVEDADSADTLCVIMEQEIIAKSRGTIHAIESSRLKALQLAFELPIGS
jgi:hypothetical protein